MTTAETVMERCMLLSRYSEEADRLTRRFATPALRQAMETVAKWMQAAGMRTEFDHVGNLIGRYEASVENAQTLLLGSHLNTVRDAGKYDGPLGVLVALACVERLHTRQERLPFAIEVLAFADEEGLRYHTAYLGSKAMTGTFDLATLHLTDDRGVTLANAINAAGGNPDPQLLRTPRWQSEKLKGYCEVHIEQGPMLEARNLPVAVVSAITGHNRFALTFTGQAGHAGTVPMALRRDALCAASEFTLTVETLARSTPGLVGTVGQLSVQPGASNVIPGQVSLSLDVRHTDNIVRKQSTDALYSQVIQICKRRRISFDWRPVQQYQTLFCTPRLIQLLQQAIEAEGYPIHTLASGAGHDAVSLSTLTDVAMLFVRCRGGISHHPAEAVSAKDVAVAIQVLERFLQFQS